MPSIMSVLGTAGRSLREGVFEPRILQQAQQRTDLKKKEQRQTEADFIIEAREAWLALDQEMLNNVLEKYKRAVPTQTFRTIAENITKAINLVKTERANKAAEKADELQVLFPQTPKGELDVESVATVSDPAFQFLKARLGRPYSYTDEGGKTITIPGMDPKEADTEIQKAYKASPQMLPISDAVQYDAVQASRDAISGRQQQANPRIVKTFVDAIIADPSTSIGILSSDIISQNTRSAILNELSSRPDFNLQGAFKAHEDAKKRPEGFQIIGGRRIPYNLYKSVEKRAIDILKTEAGKKAWGAQDQIPYDKIQAKIIELLSTMEFGNGATQSTSIAVPDTSGVDTPTAADTVSAVPDTLGVDTLTAGVPPPTTQQDIDTLFDQGMAHLTEGNNREAIAAFRRVLEKRPTHSDAHFELAKLLQADGDIQGAIKHFRHSLSGDRSRPEAKFYTDALMKVAQEAGIDTLTAGGTPAAPPPTPQQGSETFRYTDPALAQKLIDYLRAMKLQVANNVAGEIVHGERVEISGQATPIQKKAVEAWRKALDSLRIP